MAAEPWWRAWQPGLAPYGVLIALLQNGRMSAAQFEVLYLTVFKSDQVEHSEAAFGLLDRLFSDVDQFCADPDLRASTGGIDDAGLVARARTCLDGLLALPENAGCRPACRRVRARRGPLFVFFPTAAAFVVAVAGTSS